MSEDATNGRINVSEDRMRGVIAEFELRFRDWLELKLEHKADLAMLNEARKAIDGLRVDVDSLKESRSGAAVLSAWQRWFFGGGFVALAAGVVLSLLHAFAL